MLVQSKRNLAPLALLPPELPGAVDLPSGKQGINLAAAKLNFPDRGLKVQIPVYTNKDVGDQVLLYLGTSVVDQTTIRDEAERIERTTLFVPANRLQTGDWQLTYEVRRVSQGPETFTPPLDFYVKLELPGGQDTDPDYGHSNLYMAFDPPDIVQDGVDADAAKNGVDILIQAKPGSGTNLPYPDIAVDDVIHVSWGGPQVSSDPVTQAQIDDPVNNPITVHIDEKTILDTRDSGPDGLAVTYMIRDLVNNQSEDWCKETRIVVDTGNSRLEAPVLEGTNGNDFDLDQHGEGDLNVQVWAVSSDFHKDDVIIMHLEGTTLEGELVEVEVRQTIENNPPLVVDVPFASSHARALAKTQVRFAYDLEHGGTVVLRSKGRFVNLLGEPKRLQPPVARDAVNGAIDPDLAYTVIIIPFDDTMKEGMAIELLWNGTRADQSSYDPELDWYFLSREDEQKQADLRITVTGHLKTLEGGTLALSYVLLKDDNGTIVRTSSLAAAVLNVGEALLELVPPIVLGEENGALDPDALPDGASKLTAPRPTVTPTKEKDVVTYSWEGEVTGLKENSITLNALSKDKDVPFTLDATFVEDYIRPNLGKKITASYRILRFETNKTSYSNPLEFVVGEAQQPRLDPAKVREALNDVLDPANAPNGATIEIEPNRAENAGDHFYVKWATADGATIFEDDKPITGSSKGKLVEFPVERSVVLASVDQFVTISYWVELFEGGEALGTDYEFSVEEQVFKLPIATFKEATGAAEDQLNPDDVYPDGATVVIQDSAQLKTDDEVIVTVQGQTTTQYSHTVLSTEADKELLSIKVPYAVINANDGNSIALSYTVVRKAGGTDGPSDPTEYDVRKVIGSGTLKVMGARYNRSTYRASSASRVLSAFNATTGQPTQAEWKYTNGIGWTTASTWRDTAPHQPLQVRTTDDQLTLNTANIVGNGVDTTVTGQAAFVAHRDIGDVLGWGNAAYGASIPPTIITMDDIVEVSCTRSAYAARRANGAVVVWGTTAEGGSMTGIDPLNFAQVVGNATAFTGLKTTGGVVAWGTAADGGTIPGEIGNLSDIVEVIAAGQAFAARRATGQVVAWGLATNGGEVPTEIGGFTDIDTVIGSYGAFAAYRGNGRIVAWGHATYGGSVPADIAGMNDIIELSCANAQAFTARRATGQVVAWGTAAYGGTVDPLVAGLTDIVEVTSTWRAFAARRGNGHVVAWGTAAEGGDVPGDIAGLNDIVQVTGSSMAFAALRKNGTVVAWGDATVGGDTSSVVGQLTQVQAIYSNTHGFVALTADGRVVTWGHAGGGGDSSAVQEGLVGQVSYQANAASRGLALKANRLADAV